jgi:phosphohistidine phosphatase
MELILWRHAEAEDGAPDLARRLTPKGRKQAQRIAKWLNKRLEGQVVVLASPAARAQETAAALERPIETVDALAPGCTANRMLRAVDWPAAQRTVIVVGHQPTLGQLAGLLISGEELDLETKKGAIWWFSAPSGSQQRRAVLIAAITPAKA